MRKMAKASLLAALGLLAGFLLVFYGEARPKVQMLNFDHSRHQPLACQVCHRGVLKQERATVPSSEVCQKCHATSPDTSAEGAAMWRQAEEGVPVRWAVSFMLPQHVYFSHRRHAAIAGVSCESCHGNMQAQKTPVTVAFRSWKMKDCLSCHQQRNINDDCVQCHR